MAKVTAPQLSSDPWLEPPGDALVERRPNILIVDDEPRNRFALQTALEELDAEIVAAASGERALKWLLDREFAVILLDVHMPGMDGYETAELIRMREKSRHIPIIFLTAVHRDEGHMFRGYSAGAVDYVLKPVEPVILTSKIKVFIELFRNAEQIRLQGEQRRRLLAENFRVRTEKMEAEQALYRSEAQRSLIIRSLPVALYSADPAGGLRFRHFVDEKIEQIAGFPAQRFAEERDFWGSRIDPSDRERVFAEMAALPERQSVAIEYRWRCADDSYHYILDQAVLVRDLDGRPPEIFGTWLDVTERRLLEQELAHAQKLDAVGQLTGGIAHDFNNMLTVVIGSLDRVCRSVKPGDAAAMWSDMALQGALRCADMTKRLLAFARRQPLQPRRIDVNDLIRQASELLRLPLADGIEIELDCAEPLWPALADPTQLESALLNLAINARDAMPEGGRLRIATANVSTSEKALGHASSSPDDYIALSVSDTGTGMDKEVLDRVFDPFFTTKGIGEGTGLGLSMIYGFVKQSNGHITIDSEPGHGTTITLYLPRDAREEQGAAAAPTAETEVAKRRSRRGEVVLVVEDDAEVRRLAASVLGELGYKVIEAEDGAAALEILRTKRAVHLLFTDWAMPGGMNGHDLASEAVKLRPGLPVLYTSAYVDRVAAGLGELASASFLRKPYRDYELASAVARALRPRGTRPKARQRPRR